MVSLEDDSRTLELSLLLASSLPSDKVLPLAVELGGPVCPYHDPRIALKWLVREGDPAVSKALNDANTSVAVTSRLIDKMVKEKSEHRAFADLEALGCSAVPAIIKHMDDRRQLPDKNISLKNKFPDAWENVRYHGVERVVDALDAILNQMTGESFGDIDVDKDDPTKDAERAKVVSGWHDWLAKTPPSKQCFSDEYR